MIEEILKNLVSQTCLKEEVNEIIKDLDTLLSGDKYEKFLKNNVSDNRVKQTILQDFGHLVASVMLPDQILTETSPELRKRICAYLDNLLEKITKIISEEKSRILNTPNAEESLKNSIKSLDEMSNDEIIDYLFSKFADKFLG